MQEGILNYRNHSSKVHFDLEDKVYFGKIEGIDDLITFEGRSFGEARVAFQEAVDDYFEIAAELGRQLQIRDNRA